MIVFGVMFCRVLGLVFGCVPSSAVVVCVIGMSWGLFLVLCLRGRVLEIVLGHVVGPMFGTLLPCCCQYPCYCS